MQLVFLRAISSFKVGDIRDLEWDSVYANLRQFHDATEPPDAYAIPVEEAARRYATAHAASHEPTGRRPGVKAAAA